MAGCEPRCGNCHRCSTCRGDGTVVTVRHEKDWTGQQVRV